VGDAQLARSDHAADRRRPRHAYMRRLARELWRLDRGGSSSGTIARLAGTTFNVRTGRTSGINGTKRAETGGEDARTRNACRERQSLMCCARQPSIQRRLKMNMRRALCNGLKPLLVVGAMLLLSAPAVADNEFYQPSWTQLPSASTYNTTPSCPLVSATFFQCEVPASALPPQDSNNTASYLNSGYWPSEKRPDIEVYAANWLPFSPNESCLEHLPHYCYLVDAERAGYPVTHTPEVGDLWFAPGACIGWGGPSGAPPSGDCAADQDWYMGYVEQVFPDGSFIQSWGGSSTPADSGLGVTWFSGAMDPDSDFVPPMPTGTPLPVPVNASPPTIGGTYEVGGDLYVRHVGSWRNDPPATPVKRRHSWLRCNSNGASCSAILGTMSESDAYPVMAADTGHTLRVAETAENVAGLGSPALSAPTAVITKPSVPRGSSLTGRLRRNGLVLFVRGALTGRRATVSFVLRGADGRTLRSKRRITLAPKMYLYPSSGVTPGYLLHAVTVVVPRFDYVRSSFVGVTRYFVAH
jgi:hypothetical protein